MGIDKVCTIIYFNFSKLELKLNLFCNQNIIKFKLSDLNKKVQIWTLICKLLSHFNRDIHSTSGKLRRAAMQFTPERWSSVKWLDPNSSIMRVVGVYILLVMFLVSFF